MEYPWRHGPVQGNLCPTCSTSHFPFCIPRFSVDRNPQFPLEPFHRPDFVPRGSVDLHGQNLNDGFWEPRSSVRNSNLDCVPGGQSRGTMTVSGAYMDDFAPYDRAGDGYTSSADRNNKRMRVDDTGSGVFLHEYHRNPGRLEEDERRLKLVHDHGGVKGGPLQGNVNPQHFHASETNFSMGGPIEYEKFDDLTDARIIGEPKRQISVRDQGFIFPERKKPSVQQFMQNKLNGFPLDVGCGAFETHTGGRNAFGCSPVGELSQSHHRQAMHPSPDEYGSNFPSHDAYSGRQGFQSQNLAVRHGWGDGRFPALPNDVRDLKLYTCPSNQRVLSGESEVYTEHKNSLYDQRPPQGDWEPNGYPNFPGTSNYAPPNLSRQGVYSSIQSGSGTGSHVDGVMPPLPTSPPPPLPVVPPAHASSGMKPSPSPSNASSLRFPVPRGTSANVPSPYPVSEAHPLAPPYYHSKSHPPSSSGYNVEETQGMHKKSSALSMGDSHPFSLKHDTPTVIDASHLFRQPFRATRPDHIVIILRGLPGSGKSYLAKMLRDLEVEIGGSAPRIHSMDDYFMTEVEKVAESEVSSSSVRGKKPVMKKVMEYCYEPEMEEVYRASMLKAFRKTLEEGSYTFIIVDDRNLRVADFAQFWAIGKRSGYEVYLLEATYKDPVGCAARNVHGFTQEEIQKMAKQWEAAPPLYWQLDVKSLFHGDGLKDSGIQEVDMDVEEENIDEGLPVSQDRTLPSVEDCAPDAPPNDGKSQDTEQEHPAEVKTLSRSKWLDGADEHDTESTEGVKGSLNALSGLLEAYKGGKAVRWGDQISSPGFSIGAAKNASLMSLIIGPGAGYNLASNPLPEGENPAAAQFINEPERHGVFQERLRAEHESFKAVFERRRQRIGLHVEDE